MQGEPGPSDDLGGAPGPRLGDVLIDPVVGLGARGRKTTQRSRKVRTMTRLERQDLGDNRQYQSELARSLLDCLGRDGAIHACQANGWDGILDFLLAKEDEH